MATIPKLIAPRHMDRAIQFASNWEIARIIAPIGRPDMPDQPLRIFRTPRLVLEIGKNVPAFGQVRDDPPAPHCEPLRWVGVAAESEVDERSRRGKAGFGLTVC